MPKQHSDKYVVITHPMYGEQKTLDWVAESLLRKGWKLKDEQKKTETAKPEKVNNGNINQYR